MRRRNNIVYARFSDKEYEQLLQKVENSGQTIQAYIIEAALSGKITTSEEINKLKELSYLLQDIDSRLRGMGTNLNQIARVANVLGIVPTAESMTEFAEQVQDVKKEVDALWLPIRLSIAKSKTGLH